MPIDAQRPTIFVVDDDRGLLRLIEMTLKREGFSTATACSGKDAIDWLSKTSADLMLLDLKLPDIEGKELINHLAAIQREIPFIIITGHGNERVAVEMMKRGALDYLVKDFDFLQFVPEVARRALQQLQKERELTETRSQLREKIGELEAFSYSVSHDMRAPLRAMQGFAQILVDEYSGKLDEQGLDYLHQIMRSAVRLDRLIQDVLSYSGILRAELPMEQVDMDRLVRDIIETYPYEGPIKPEIKIKGTLPKVVGNKALLTQCVSNLLSNGIKFVSRGTAPRVEIWAEAVGDAWIRVWFKDNGIGIAPENRDRIFRMFERINPAAEYEGTGIGLTIVRKAIQRMGAQVGFESELGKGSKFWIQLAKA